MTFLNKLKLAPELNEEKIPALVRARNRLLLALNEQLKCADAMVKGDQYTINKFRVETNEQTGIRKRIPYQSPIRKWYWRDSEGVVRFAVRVGNKKIELANGKTNIIVGDDKNLPSVIQTCIKAAEAGELDAAIDEEIKSRKSNKRKNKNKQLTVSVRKQV